MKRVFADTSFWVALLDDRDGLHTRAMELETTLTSTKVITTEEVLGEFLTYFSGLGPKWREKSVKLVTALRSDPQVQVQAQSHESFLAGLDLYRRRPDKEYSFIDCVSMQTMRQLGLTEVLSSDHHFEQEGFTLLIPIR